MGELARVAVVDSILDLPDEAPDNLEVRNKESIIPDNSRDTTGHGTHVTQIITPFAENSTFDFYRVVTSDGKFKTTNYLKALNKAVDNGVDVLNISAGATHSGCEQNCRICVATSRVVNQHDIPVVAAAGNKKDIEDDLEVMCPARSKGAIAVGGFVVYCTANADTHKDHSSTVGPAPRFPGTYWDQSDPQCPSYCGQYGCTGTNRDESPDEGLFNTAKEATEANDQQLWSIECAENKLEAEWPGNPDPVFDKPDVLAPVHFPIEDENNQYCLSAGTSYAAPFVTGAISNIVSELAIKGKYPEATTIKRIITESAKDLDEEAPAGRLSIKNAVDHFLDHYNFS